MIRILARGLAAMLLEIATAAAFIALVMVALSAYLLARFVGINVRTNKTATAIKVARDLLAMGIETKRRASRPFPADDPDT
jgi:hypothetical protein